MAAAVAAHLLAGLMLAQGMTGTAPSHALADASLDVEFLDVEILNEPEAQAQPELASIALPDPIIEIELPPPLAEPVIEIANTPKPEDATPPDSPAEDEALPVAALPAPEPEPPEAHPVTPEITVDPVTITVDIPPPPPLDLGNTATSSPVDLTTATLPPPARIERAAPPKAALKPPMSRAATRQQAAPAKPHQMRAAVQPQRSQATPRAPGNDGYGQTVATRLRRNAPNFNTRTGAQGSVIVLLSIDPSGALASARITHSSGSASLDTAALANVRAAAPFPPPPNGVIRHFSQRINIRR